MLPVASRILKQDSHPLPASCQEKGRLAFKNGEGGVTQDAGKFSTWGLSLGITGDRGRTAEFPCLDFCFLLILILFSIANTFKWFKIQKVIQ